MEAEEVNQVSAEPCCRRRQQRAKILAMANSKNYLEDLQLPFVPAVCHNVFSMLGWKCPPRPCSLFQADHP